MCKEEKGAIFTSFMTASHFLCRFLLIKVILNVEIRLEYLFICCFAKRNPKHANYKTLISLRLKQLITFTLPENNQNNNNKKKGRKKGRQEEEIFLYGKLSIYSYSFNVF